MAQLVERPPSTQDVAGSSPARGSSFFLLRKKELSSGVVVYLALSLRMSLHVHIHLDKCKVSAVKWIATCTTCIYVLLHAIAGVLLSRGHFTQYVPDMFSNGAILLLILH